MLPDEHQPCSYTVCALHYVPSHLTPHIKVSCKSSNNCISLLTCLKELHAV